MACYWLLVFIFVSIQVVYVQTETCTYTRTAGVRSKTPRQPHFGKADITACEAVCTADQTCVASYFDPPICYTSTTTATEAKGTATHSLKSCVAGTTMGATTSTAAATTEMPSTAATTEMPSTAATTEIATTEMQSTAAAKTEMISTAATSNGTAGFCTMNRQTDKVGSGEAFVSLSVTDVGCRDLCRSLSDCKSVSYDSTQCKIYTEDTSTQAKTGSTHATISKCLTGLACCYNTEENTSGAMNASWTITNSLESCELLCKSYSSCVSLSWTDNKCVLYTSIVTNMQKSGSTFATKVCTVGAVTGSTFKSTCQLSIPSTATSYFIQPYIILIVLIMINMLQ